jgi:ubiquinone/menaquinone biosynthesis C-methylase UbiE
MSFDRLAPHYRWLEFVLAGQKLQRCRLAWLDEIRDCRDMLIVGVGPGKFLQACPRELPQARIVCVDASQAMLERARTTWRKAGGKPRRASFIHAALPEWQPPPAAFDLIVTHFFLDCFPEPTLSQVIAKLALAAQPAARWLISDFQIPSSRLAGLRAKAVLAMAYTFFKLATRLPAGGLSSPEALLDRHGFQLLHRRTFDYGLLYSEVRRR